MPRAILIVLDSVGCGGAPDAEAFGDQGANTLGHIIAARAAANTPIALPNMDALGLGATVRLSTGIATPGLAAEPTGIWGVVTEHSRGKDTPSGHWELAGLPVPFEWHYFPEEIPAFPSSIVQPLVARSRIPGILGNKHASGISILDALGAESVRTGKPICYTSVDSVFQIAAHETHFGLDRLYEMCEIAAELVHPLRVGRVIARPFVGEDGKFTRTANRRDYAIAPPAPTICTRITKAGGKVHSVGKIKDIFAGHGISTSVKGKTDDENIDLTLRTMTQAGSGDLIFTNLVDFDTLYGHRRDVMGYAAQLEAFDRRLPELMSALDHGDLLILTADHGNDPTWGGTDHTRERVPVLATGPALASRAIGIRAFADVGETIAAHLGLRPGAHGESFL